METQETQLSTPPSASLSSDLSARARVALAQGRGGILGVKAGMTQVYTEAGDLVAVTVIDLKPAVITQVKTHAKEGYNGVQVGLLPKSDKSATRAERGHAKKSGGSSFYHVQEFRLEDDDKLEGLTAGAVLSAEFLQPGDYVDLTARSKGKGFQGGMKRFHMAGGYKSHGASVSHRQLGSIGNRADPAKCFRNKKMAGHMGDERVTVQNVRVAKVDLENQILLVHGSVPGPKSGVVTVRKAVKR